MEYVMLMQSNQITQSHASHAIIIYKCVQGILIPSGVETWLSRGKIICKFAFTYITNLLRKLLTWLVNHQSMNIYKKF